MTKRNPKLTKAKLSAIRRAAGRKGNEARRLSAEQMRARGSTRAKARALEEHNLQGVPCKQPKDEKVTGKMEAIAFDEARKAYLCAVIREIPGFDPYRGAEVGGFIFREELAHAALEFFRLRIRHVKGSMARKPFELRSWQEAIIANLFGWLRADGSRRFREAFVYVPKKNGKTALVGGIIVYVLAEDAEDGQENYSAAASRDQAALVFQYAAGMIRQDPELSSRLRVFGNSGGSQLKSIVYDKSGIISFYKALAADANHADGVNVHLGIIDELHRHPNGELADVISKSTAARTNPLVVTTTTADYDRPESPCNRKLAYARQVLANPEMDMSFLPVIFEAGKDDDWTAEATWAKANPNYNVTVFKDFFEREVKKALEDPSSQNDFKRLHLNIVTEQAVVWLPMDKWAACSGAGAEDPVAWRAARLAEMAGKPCLSGLDLGSTSDLTAFVLRFALADGGALFLPWFWMPTDGIRTKAPDFARLYEAWIAAGFIRGTPGNVADYDTIRADIKALKGMFDIREVACDPWNGMQLMTQLQGDGLAVIQFRQGFASLAGPSKAFGERVLGGRMVHGANPVLRWMASNAQVLKDVAGNIKPVKGKDTQRKIDGIVAAIMAEGLAMVAPVQQGSVYDTRGIESL